MQFNYQVVPFVAKVGSAEGSQAAAQQLQSLISQMSNDGWEYVRLETVQTVIAGSNGCFGLFGVTPAQVTTFAMAVFKK